MRFGLLAVNTGAYATAEGARALVPAAAAAGFESLWAVEHVVVPAGHSSAYPYSRTGKMPGGHELPVTDPFGWLCLAAALDPDLLLGTAVVIGPLRTPLFLAKESATVDVLSSGRAILGLGVGWLEEEFEVSGVPFAERGRRLDEAIDALRVLWGEPLASFAGPFTRFDDCVSRPQPVRGAIPVVIGGGSEAAARRAGRRGDGFFPLVARERLAGLIATVRTEAERAGRDPDAVEITAEARPATVEVVEELESMGVSRVTLRPPTNDIDAIGDELAALMDQVAPTRPASSPTSTSRPGDESSVSAVTPLPSST